MSMTQNDVDSFPAVIALVDDEVPITQAIQTLLSFKGLASIAYDSAESLLSELTFQDGHLFLTMANGAQAKVSAVLLDMNLPEMNGANLVVALRRLQADVPLIMMTASLQQVLDARTADLDGVTFLKKPFTLDSLEQALQLS